MRRLDGPDNLICTDCQAALEEWRAKWRAEALRNAKERDARLRRK